ncbi:hypothetical protein VTN02DRAFT_2353 [Thermoascus thermophilus]
MHSVRGRDVQTTAWKRWSSQPLAHPIQSLTLAFGVWKALLALVIVGCPGPGYDTSTTLAGGAELAADFGQLGDSSALRKFVRWDSIYFVRIADRGYLFEQEWAFGYGYTRLLSLLSSAFDRTDQVSGPAQIARLGVVLSHLGHFVSVLALYGLTKNVFGSETNAKKAFCFLSASLHIVSPAGAFLSAPYAEPVFSALNIAGFYIYSSAFLDDRVGRSFSRDVKLLISAVLFAAATTLRSNGILSGLLFAYDAIVDLVKLASGRLSAGVLRHLAVIVTSGMIVALGMVGPQYIAYTAYCTRGANSRPWCTQLIPSIYGWVQAHYWNVGFLRYWTLSNLPLFLLAAPMLLILCLSSLWALCKTGGGQQVEQARSDRTDIQESLLMRLAVPQGLLAVMAITSYHVQIINRISSGYPLWYWYLVSQVLNSASTSKTTPTSSRRFAVAVQGMVMYALIQAVLFGSFLPPA